MVEIFLGITACFLLLVIAARLTRIRDALCEINSVTYEVKIELLKLREQIAVLSQKAQKLEEPLAEYLDFEISEHYEKHPHLGKHKN